MKYSAEEAVKKIQQLQSLPLQRTQQTLEALRASGENGVTVRELTKILGCSNPASYILRLRRAGHEIITQHTSTQDLGTGIPRRQGVYHIIEIDGAGDLTGGAL